jgi:DNA helicase IV
MRAGLLKELADDDRFASALGEMWPLLTPEELLGSLYSSPERLTAAGADASLHRADGEAWTVSDVPLLDELHELLGRDGTMQAADQATLAEKQAEARYAAEVLDSMVGRQDHMDDEDHLFATDLMFAEDLAERFDEHDTRTLVERASADRGWTYRHVVVDEAQELSAMDWRVLMRRCPGRSFTVVGDLAQRRSSAGATSWGAMLDPYVPGRWIYRSLTVNYRTPAEIMAVAAQVLAEFAPDVQAPESVRANGIQPWSRQVSPGELSAAIAEFVTAEASSEGTSVVIGPPGVPGTIPASETKGLEYDAVLVVAPEQILADGPRGAAELYVALTRATQRLGVLHHSPLPAALAGLTETVRT